MRRSAPDSRFFVATLTSNLPNGNLPNRNLPTGNPPVELEPDMYPASRRAVLHDAAAHPLLVTSETWDRA
ncbi:hypothetical protein GCM10012319_02550 [Comamonas sp. KCTC 72670]|nr:hypothetical protein GCM10012319_02550 [Comamonas sp. KCTC 72670]